MAIYHLSCKIISRSKGKSSVASAAYRSCEKLVDERTGEINDYTKKKALEYSEILTPENCPERFKHRKILWNEVEKIEKRKDSQLAKEIEVGLPKELNRIEQINLIKDFVKENFIKNGMIADINLHDTGNGNPHVHIMLTTRYINEDGFGQKNRDWNDKELLKSWREKWAVITNLFLEKNNISERIDHRSYKDQGVNKLPTIHMGVSAHAMEKKGIQTDRGDINRNIKEHNNITIEIEELQKQREELEKTFKSDERSLQEIKEEYIKLTMDCDENYNKIKQLRTKISFNENRLSQLSKFKEIRYSQEIILAELKEKKLNATGIFKAKERKEIDKQIQSQILNMNDTVTFYKSKNIEDININDIKNEILKYQNDIDNLKDNNVNIKSKLNDLEIDYKYKLINNSINGIQESTEKFKSDSIVFNIELNKIEVKLNKITYIDLDKILEKHPYDKNLKLFVGYKKERLQKEFMKSNLDIFNLEK